MREEGGGGGGVMEAPSVPTGSVRGRKGKGGKGRVGAGEGPRQKTWLGWGGR